MPRGSSQTRTQKEVPIAILQWLGMQSNAPTTAIPVNAFSYVLNFDYITEHEVSSRKGTTEWMGNTTTGSVAIIGGYEFSRRADTASRIMFVTSTGKLYRVSSLLSGQTPTFIGNLTTSTTLTKAFFATFKGKLYIADGTAGWEYDPDTDTVTQVTFPSDYTGKIICVLARDSSLQWWADTGETILSSVNEATEYETGTAWRGFVGSGDEMDAVMMLKWLQTVVFIKRDNKTRKTAMYKMTGYSEANFRIDPMYSGEFKSTGFIGRSPADLGNDIIGLTQDGFSSISAIDTFNETTISNFSKDVDDYIRRINFSQYDLITAIYNTNTRQYMAACPIDSANTNNIIFIYHAESRRWGLYDNWDVRCFFTVAGTVFFGTSDGRLVQTGVGENDEGNGFSKIIEGPDWHFDSPDTLKLFKTLNLDLAQDGEYDINFTPIINGNYLNATTIPLTLKPGGVWDEFVWDVDPWDTPLEINREIYLLARGRTLRYRLFNDQPDEPFSLRSVTARSFITDAGSVS